MKCASKEGGEQCVMTYGTPEMQVLLADSLDSAQKVSSLLEHSSKNRKWSPTYISVLPNLIVQPNWIVGLSDMMQFTIVLQCKKNKNMTGSIRGQQYVFHYCRR